MINWTIASNDTLCFSKIQIGFAFLVPAHLGSPGKRAVKRVCVCVILFSMIKAVNVTYGSSFSNQWEFTMSVTEVFKYNFLNFYIGKNFAVYFVEISVVHAK